MQGKRQFTNQVITHFRLSERVPVHNLYRRLGALLQLDFMYEATQDLYSHTGQPSLDPVVFFQLVGYLQNSTRDPRLLKQCALRLDILLFLGYELDEELPWHSTLSRTRQLYPAALFEQLFNRVFRLCVAQGLVKGDTQVIGSAPMKANASLNSVCEKRPPALFPPLQRSARNLPRPPRRPPLCAQHPRINSITGLAPVMSFSPFHVSGLRIQTLQGCKSQRRHLNIRQGLRMQSLPHNRAAKNNTKIFIAA
jgi:transposase